MPQPAHVVSRCVKWSMGSYRANLDEELETVCTLSMQGLGLGLEALGS